MLRTLARRVLAPRLAQAPWAVIVLAREPALCVRRSLLHQRDGELAREEQVAEQLAARGARARLERAPEQRDARGRRGVQQARVALAEHPLSDRADLIGL